MTANPIIVALDFADAKDARQLVSRLGGAVDFYKVGMELYAAAGMSFVHELGESGKHVFLDLKLYDIPETVKRAVAQVAKTDVRFLTVHGSNAIMKAAVEGRAGSGLELLAVTVLTSFDQQDLAELGYAASIPELVSLRVRNALAAGFEGIVCSPLEAAAVRAEAGPQAIIVTPGVRSASAEVADQKRVATPQQALEAGATYVVIGREVTRATDPRAAVERVVNAISIPS